MSEERFEQTATGYLMALGYLAEIGESKAIKKELSTDGYTVVALANDFYNKMVSEK